jgi:cytidine deaminase
MRVYENREELPEELCELLRHAEETATRAYAKYSHFQVGAAILMNNGKVVTGANQENAVYPCGLCAERVAAFAASTLYPEVPFNKIAVTAINPDEPLKEPVSPCGSCRQVLSNTSRSSAIRSRSSSPGRKAPSTISRVSLTCFRTPSTPDSSRNNLDLCL